MKIVLFCMTSANEQDLVHEHDDGKTNGDRKEVDALRLARIYEKSTFFADMKEDGDRIFKGFTTTKEPPRQSVHYPTSFLTQVRTILPYFGKRKQVTYHLNLSYWCLHILPSVLCFQAKFYA